MTEKGKKWIEGGVLFLIFVTAFVVWRFRKLTVWNIITIIGGLAAVFKINEYITHWYSKGSVKIDKEQVQEIKETVIREIKAITIESPAILFADFKTSLQVDALLAPYQMEIGTLLPEPEVYTKIRAFGLCLEIKDIQKAKQILTSLHSSLYNTGMYTQLTSMQDELFRLNPRYQNDDWFNIRRARVLKDCGDLKNSKYFYLKVISTGKDKRNRLIAQKDLAEIIGEEGNFRRAEEIFLQCQATFELINHPLGSLYYYDTIHKRFVLEVTSGHYDNNIALEKIDDQLVKIKNLLKPQKVSIGDIEKLAGELTLIKAKILFSLGRYQESELLLISCEDILRKVRDRFNLVNIYNCLAILYKKIGRRDLSNQFRKKADDNFRQL